jgi:hypothetical protein
VPPDGELVTDIKVEVVPKASTRGDLRSGTVTEKLLDRIDDVSNAVLEVSQKLKIRLDAGTDDILRPAVSAWALDSVEISFSMDLEAEAGVVVTRASASVGFEVKLCWSHNS